MANDTQTAEPQPSAGAPRPPRKQAGAPRNRGDFTGAQKEALQMQHGDEQSAAAKRLTTVTAEVQRSIDEDVVDLSDPGNPLLVHPDGTTEPYAGPATLDEETDDIDLDADDDEIEQMVGSDSSIGLLKEPEEVPVSLSGSPEWRAMSPDRRAEYMDELVVVRINGDYEEVTLGKDTTISFEYGRRYRLKRWQSIHLDEKGMVWH